jgi:hypothetical protein
MKERNEGQKVTKDTKVTWPKGYEGYMAKRLRRIHGQKVTKVTKDTFFFKCIL